MTLDKRTKRERERIRAYRATQKAEQKAIYFEENARPGGDYRRAMLCEHQLRMRDLRGVVLYEGTNKTSNTRRAIQQCVPDANFTEVEVEDSASWMCLSLNVLAPKENGSCALADGGHLVARQQKVYRTRATTRLLKDQPSVDASESISMDTAEPEAGAEGLLELALHGPPPALEDGSCALADGGHLVTRQQKDQPSVDASDSISMDTAEPEGPVQVTSTEVERAAREGKVEIVRTADSDADKITIVVLPENRLQVIAIIIPNAVAGQAELFTKVAKFNMEHGLAKEIRKHHVRDGGGLGDMDDVNFNTQTSGNNPHVSLRVWYVVDGFRVAQGV